MTTTISPRPPSPTVRPDTPMMRIGSVYVRTKYYVYLTECSARELANMGLPIDRENETIVQANKLALIIVNDTIRGLFKSFSAEEALAVPIERHLVDAGETISSAQTRSTESAHEISAAGRLIVEKITSKKLEIVSRLAEVLTTVLEPEKIRFKFYSEVSEDGHAIKESLSLLNTDPMTKILSDMGII